MKPQKIIVRRASSGPAHCSREIQRLWAPPKICGAALRLNIVPNCIRGLPFTQLVTITCMAGHVLEGSGVLDYDPPCTLNLQCFDEDDDGDEASDGSRW